jgi:hypothetical protein
MDKARDWITTNEMEAEFGLPRPRQARWRWLGTGPPYFKVVGTVMYRRSDVVDWLESQRHEPGEDAA